MDAMSAFRMGLAFFINRAVFRALPLDGLWLAVASGPTLARPALAQNHI
ncbi:MAG TPA: hypothetical protein VHY91_14250 [Pirellulales bacterium]|jgi:hypothetical protein|nr:hypothetical protein [Pirellulales bacterium]